MMGNWVGHLMMEPWLDLDGEPGGETTTTWTRDEQPSHHLSTAKSERDAYNRRSGYSSSVWSKHTCEPDGDSRLNTNDNFPRDSGAKSKEANTSGRIWDSNKAGVSLPTRCLSCEGHGEAKSLGISIEPWPHNCSPVPRREVFSMDWGVQGPSYRWGFAWLRGPVSLPVARPQTGSWGPLQ